ncbi:MAG: hypothetical protein ACYYKD_08765 [Rhodospirillales bacterium]
MRTALAWIVGFFTASVVYLVIAFFAEFLGLAIRVEYGETIVITHRLYDEERDGHLTALGWLVTFLTFASGIWAGRAVYTGNWAIDFKSRNVRQVVVTGVCLSLYALIMTTAWEVFGRELLRAPAIVANLLDLAAIAMCVWLGFKYYKVWELRVKNERD